MAEILEALTTIGSWKECSGSLHGQGVKSLNLQRVCVLGIDYCNSPRGVDSFGPSIGDADVNAAFNIRWEGAAGQLNTRRLAIVGAPCAIWMNGRHAAPMPFQ